MLPRISFVLPLLCVVACVHLAVSLPVRLSDRYYRAATVMEEEGAGSNSTAGCNATEPANGTAACCNVTSPLSCHSVHLECELEQEAAEAAMVSNLTEQLRNRGSLERGLEILRAFSGGLFDLRVSARAARRHICL